MVTQNPALPLFLAVLLFLLVRTIYYQTKLRSIEGYRSKYEKYLDAISKDGSDWESFDRFAECQTEIIKLFEQAGLSSGLVPVYEKFPLGNNLHVKTGTVQPLEHLTATDDQIVASNRKTFHEAIGYFRARRDETVSIVFWVDMLIFHPRKIVAAVGGNKDGLVAILLNVVAIPSEAIAIYEWFTR